jgi:hypothetical protein
MDSLFVVDWGPEAVAMPSSVPAKSFYRAAKQRFDDTLLLLEMDRTTAAVYLAGYSVECTLKALILSAVPPTQDEEILGLFRGARAHDYKWLLQVCAGKGGARLPPSVVPHFARATSWSTDTRYTPGRIAACEAKAFVESAAEIILWAEGRLYLRPEEIAVPHLTCRFSRSWKAWQRMNVLIRTRRLKDADTVLCPFVSGLSIPIFGVSTALSASRKSGNSYTDCQKTCW